MARNKIESHEKIVEVAKNEFLEKGFEKASMRSIGQKVGLTQAALYRHFESKEDMFESLVNPVLEAIRKMTDNHIERQYGLIDLEKDQHLFEDNQVEMVKELLNNYKDEFRLLLCCAHGTKYSNFEHDFVVEQENGMLEALKVLKGKGKNVAEISKDELHALLSAYTAAIFEPIKHNWSVEKTLHNLNVVEQFFMAGFKEIMGY